MIAVSAGHYPAAPGAVYEGFVEHDHAVKWADKVTELLKEQGYKVTRIPTGHLQDKVHHVNESGAKLAIEIHFNSDAKHNAHGCVTLYCPGSHKGERLASLVQSGLSSFFPPNRGVKEGWYRLDPSRGPDYFLSHTVPPAIIVEPEFVENANKIEANFEVACKMIADGLIDAYKEFYE